MPYRAARRVTGRVGLKRAHAYANTDAEAKEEVSLVVTKRWEQQTIANTEAQSFFDSQTESITDRDADAQRDARPGSGSLDEDGLGPPIADANRASDTETEADTHRDASRSSQRKSGNACSFTNRAQNRKDVAKSERNQVSAEKEHVGCVARGQVAHADFHA